ncbi:WD40 repeat domain-containing protein [Azoarcus olearius]|uniref:Anaphase-promoting complex subunit 4-like WD40 domain-containing protein n=1 Tax=Azoarcus sp. (strain BH72) TaxID=418699 RepID=A1K4S3_AZOSB|nr:WD40 repeat domain-containing protein [Azoarcus olearius]CAL93828.1 conserved hypothetical protein [Azoarcus olearius]
MNAPLGGLPPLVALCGAHWRLEAPVVAVAWSRRGGPAAFAMGDGGVVFARPPTRPGGQGAPGLVRMEAHAGACLALAADPAGGFVSGGDDGRLLHLDPAAGAASAPAVLADHRGEWLDHVAVGARGLRACASGRRVWLHGPGSEAVLELASGVTALAFDPAGGRLAIAGHGGVELWSAADGARRRLEAPGYHRALAWSPDGRYLASGMQENALCCWRLGDGQRHLFEGYPGQPRALGFAARGHLLASNGGPRVVSWDLDHPRPASTRSESGYPGRVPVSALAWHPSRALLAAGYHNGAVLLCRPGSDQHLFVQGSGAGPVTALAWAADGAALALGTQHGELAVVAIPAQILSMARAA